MRGWRRARGERNFSLRQQLAPCGRRRWRETNGLHVHVTAAGEVKKRRTVFAKEFGNLHCNKCYHNVEIGFFFSGGGVNYSHNYP